MTEVVIGAPSTTAFAKLAHMRSSASVAPRKDTVEGHEPVELAGVVDHLYGDPGIDQPRGVVEGFTAKWVKTCRHEDGRWCVLETCGVQRREPSVIQRRDGFDLGCGAIGRASG